MKIFLGIIVALLGLGVVCEDSPNAKRTLAQCFMVALLVLTIVCII